MTGKLDYQVTDAVAWLRFDNPGKHNAMSLEMWRSLGEFVARAASDPTVRVLALTGAGETSFVSGSDVSGFGESRNSPEAVRLYGEAVEQGLAALYGFAKPSIAVVRGYCIGGGLSIAAASDLRLASASASFAIPAGRLGVGYSYGQIERLQSLVGPSVVRDLIFTSRRMTAAEALRCGLVNEMAQTEEFDALVAKRIDAVAANAPLTLKAAKLASATLLREASPTDVEAVEAAIMACFESDDYREGQAAFAEKRKPRFRGV